MNSLPTDLQAFAFSSDVHSTYLQQNSGRISIIHIPSIKTVIYGNKSVKYHCADLWNKTFKSGIAIDNKTFKSGIAIYNNTKINVAVKQIRNATQFKRLVKHTFYIVMHLINYICFRSFS